MLWEQNSIRLHQCMDVAPGHRGGVRTWWPKADQERIGPGQGSRRAGTSRFSRDVFAVNCYTLALVRVWRSVVQNYVNQ